MIIEMNRNGKELVVKVEGKLDTLTAPDLEHAIKNALDDVNKLVFDFSDLHYITSAGLRVLLLAMQLMEGHGSLVVRNACKEVMDVFKITGFDNELTIEQS